jgi:hypothetical protein
VKNAVTKMVFTDMQSLPQEKDTDTTVLPSAGKAQTGNLAGIR